MIANPGGICPLILQRKNRNNPGDQECFFCRRMVGLFVGGIGQVDGWAGRSEVEAEGTGDPEDDECGEEPEDLHAGSENPAVRPGYKNGLVPE